jgi:hypothetical protein
MLALLLAQLPGWIVSFGRVSIGPYGWIAWLQPPHLALGLGWVHGHATGYLEYA